MTIPDGLDVALISDDPVVRKQAIGALVQGTAQTVHREVVKSMRQEFARASSRDHLASHNRVPTAECGRSGLLWHLPSVCPSGL